jgi:L,D-peptidoglycan transpeptidase YkuD (ErfK/YbiS/YcfS/YnhG family)
MFKQMINVIERRGANPKNTMADLSFGPHRASCALGAGGLTAHKTEGDRKTPIGEFELRRLWMRQDRVRAPEMAFPIAFPIHYISPKSGWCDAPESRFYNRPIERPFAASHERLWRRDGLYDVFFELGYNDVNPIAGEGSAIFLHLQKNNFNPTLGCVAVSWRSMAFLLRHARPGCRVDIARNA